MTISIISFTARGDELNRRMAELLAGDMVFQVGKGFNPSSESLSEWTKKAFETSGAVIFIGAAAIAVRAIAPYIKSKLTDPAVLAADEAGRYVIPLLSGHIGGANGLAQRLAKLLGAEAIITTATDSRGIFAVDTWAANGGYAIANPEEIKYISAALLDGDSVGLMSDFEISGDLPEGVIRAKDGRIGICVSGEDKTPFTRTLRLIPKRYVIGVGSRRDACKGALTELFETLGIDRRAVSAVATIDIKRNERSVTALAEYLGAELLTYSADELNRAEGDFSASEFVKSTVGTDNVCERAAAVSGGRIIIRKTRGRGVTIAASELDWRVRF